jgi:hypothetical protein
MNLAERKKVKYNILLISTLFFIVGCTNKIHPAFYDVVLSNNDLVTETNTALISSIQQDIQTNTYSDQQKQDALNLINRLQFIIHQSDAMKKYVKQNADQETISELLKLRWKKEN